jgi:phosphoribosyl 1,2-cyclic phosphodiesterase
MLRFCSLGSGSSGNATVVEAGSGTSITRLLIDCGFGIRQLDARLARAGLVASDLHAVFVTHEHGDHVGCARALALRHRIPVWTSEGTFQAIGMPDFDGLLNLARDAETLAVRDLQLSPFAVPHDAREPLQLTCTDGARRVGVLTDLGHASSHVLASLAGCHALLLECNHDPDLLAASRYPAFLKQRVGGRHGHLSNAAAAAVLKEVRHTGLRHVVAAHLSRQNNRPELAQEALASVLDCTPDQVGIADPLTGTGWHHA